MNSIITILLDLLIPSVSALRVVVPPSDGNQDIAVTGPTQIESNSDIVLNYIKLINEYLRIAMIVVSFGVLVWMGFKLFTNEAGTDGAKDVLKNWFTWLAAGIILILFSYTIVRLVINIF